MSQQKVNQLVQEAYDLGGPDGLRAAVMKLGKAEVISAVMHLYNQGWWTSQLEAAFVHPNAVQIGLINRLIDKLLPSPKAVESKAEAQETFTVVYQNPTPPNP